MTFAEKAIKFFLNLNSPESLPKEINSLNPYKDPEVQNIVKSFYKKFYDDNNMRIFIWGINPGRFGGGVTGIAFTDPIALEKQCGIKNNLKKRPELSSRFIFSLINEYGEIKKFYSEFFLSAVYPLALLKDGKNYNYYDNKELFIHLKPHLISSLKNQISLGAMSNTAICLGKKNYGYLSSLNEELGYFKNIITFDHPRFIMQYRLKEKNIYIRKYIKILASCITGNI